MFEKKQIFKFQIVKGIHVATVGLVFLLTLNNACGKKRYGLICIKLLIKISVKLLSLVHTSGISIRTNKSKTKECSQACNI